jgi:transcriptional antiterminator NusG
MSDNKARWYVLHTYSGYENKVKMNLEKTVENRGLQEKVVEVIVPMENQVQFDDDKKKSKVIQRKVLPGYVLVKMIMDDETWYIARNVKGVTGFVGPGSKPEPLTDYEVEALGVSIKLESEYEVGESVKITGGSLKDFPGVIEEINMEKQKLKIMVSMFGRETPTEVKFNQVEKI